MSLMILIILASGVFLVGGVAPKMHDDTLNMASTGVVEGVKSDGVSGSSFAAAPGTNNESKKSLQMKQLILTTATPTRPPKIEEIDQWDIFISPISCSSGLGKTSLTLKGPKNGYLKLEISNTSGGFYSIDTGFFHSKEHKMTLTIANSLGFDKSKWKLSLYESGTELDSQWSGGILRKELIQEPTGC